MPYMTYRQIISEKTAEIERLKAEIENLNVELVGMRGACESYKIHYDNAQAEIERLQTVKKHINNLILKDCDYATAEAYNKAFIEALERLYDNVNTKSEAIKEFAEGLKERAIYIPPIGDRYGVDVVFIEDIDFLVKEMVGE